jgi:hypothetical protein
VRIVRRGWIAERVTVGSLRASNREAAEYMARLQDSLSHAAM